MKRIFAKVFLRWGTATAVLAATAATVTAAEPGIVASIPPVHSLVAAVAEGVATPRLLVPGNASPHGYALRPSDLRALEAADVVFWIGPGMEGFLEKALHAAASAARIVTLSEAAGVTLLPARAGGDRHDDEPAHEAEHEAEHEHGGTDLHLWLDPANARAILRAAARELSALVPAEAARFDANAAAAGRRLDAAEARARAALAPVAARPFIAFHDAFQYFERAFGLVAAGTVVVGPDRLPGAGRVRDLRARIASGAVGCVVHEPQFSPRLVETLIANSPARTAVLDPLGAGLEPGPGLYPALIEGNASRLAECLKVDSGPRSKD